MSSDIKLNREQNVATAAQVEWLDPYNPKTPPPRGIRIEVLTWGGVKTDAVWTGESHQFFAAWCPKPSKPDWLKKRLSDYYKGNFKPASTASVSPNKD